jgi:uncharacterized membrane protein
MRLLLLLAASGLAGAMQEVAIISIFMFIFIFIFIFILIFIDIKSTSHHHPHHQAERRELRLEAADMFYHGFEAYMAVAWPADELMPLSCRGRVR